MISPRSASCLLIYFSYSSLPDSVVVNSALCPKPTYTLSYWANNSGTAARHTSGYMFRAFQKCRQGFISTMSLCWIIQSSIDFLFQMQSDSTVDLHVVLVFQEYFSLFTVTYFILCIRFRLKTKQECVRITSKRTKWSAYVLLYILFLPLLHPRY